MRQRNRKGLLGTLGATIVAGALVLGGTVAAWADANPATIDPDAKGTINITKYSNPGGALADGTGEAWSNPPEGAEPIEGVTYSLWKIDGIDLTQNAGWLALQGGTLGIDPDYGVPTFTLEGGTGPQTKTLVSSALTTDEAGFVSATNLDVGAYIIQELSGPDSVIVNPTPYLITVPMTDPADRDAWVYDIYVYPKNAEVFAQKAVNDAESLTVGDEITYEITSQLPNFAEDGAKAFTKVEVVDIFPDTVDVTDATVAVRVAGVALEADDFEATWDGNELTVALTADYLSSQGIGLNGKEVSVLVGAKVGDGVETGTSLTTISNTANITVVTSGTDSATTPTSTVVSRYAGAQFEKKFAGGTVEEEDFAEFAIFSTEALARANDPDTALATSTATQGTDEQEVLFQGLRASDWALDAPQTPGVVNNAETCVANPDYQIYWLVETYAPEGFELLAAPVPVVLLETSTEGTYEFRQVAEPIAYQTASLGDEGDGCAFAADPAGLDGITNVQKNAGFALPLTGGMGTLWLILGGGVLLAVVLLVARRRQGEEV